MICGMEVVKKSPSVGREQCANVLEELMLTERQYVDDLRATLEYRYVLDEQLSENGMGDAHDGLFPQEIVAFFDDLRRVYQANNVLYGNLVRCSSSVSNVGICFLKSIAELSVYTKYILAYPKALTLLDSVSAQEPLKSLLASCQRKLGHSLPLSSYLLKPVQRILKYQLLLEKIQSCPDCQRRAHQAGSAGDSYHYSEQPLSKASTEKVSQSASRRDLRRKRHLKRISRRAATGTSEFSQSLIERDSRHEPSLPAATSSISCDRPSLSASRCPRPPSVPFRSFRAPSSTTAGKSKNLSPQSRLRSVLSMSMMELQSHRHADDDGRMSHRQDAVVPFTSSSELDARHRIAQNTEQENGTNTCHPTVKGVNLQRAAIHSSAFGPEDARSRCSTHPRIESASLSLPRRTLLDFDLSHSSIDPSTPSSYHSTRLKRLPQAVSKHVHDWSFKYRHRLRKTQSTSDGIFGFEESLDHLANGLESETRNCCCDTKPCRDVGGAVEAVSVDYLPDVRASHRCGLNSCRDTSTGSPGSKSQLCSSLNKSSPSSASGDLTVLSLYPPVSSPNGDVARAQSRERCLCQQKTSGAQVHLEVTPFTTEGATQSGSHLVQVPISDADDTRSCEGESAISSTDREEDSLASRSDSQDSREARPELDYISEALAAITELQVKLNELKGEDEMATRKDELLKQLSGFDDDLALIIPTCGSLIKEGALRLINSKSVRYVILFERVIILSKKREDGSNIMIYKGHIATDQLMVLPLELDCIRLIEPHNKGKFFVLQAKNEAERCEWFTAILDAVLRTYGAAVPVETRSRILDFVSKDDLKSKACVVRRKGGAPAGGSGLSRGGGNNRAAAAGGRGFSSRFDRRRNSLPPDSLFPHATSFASRPVPPPVHQDDDGKASSRKLLGLIAGGGKKRTLVAEIPDRSLTEDDTAAVMGKDEHTIAPENLSALQECDESGLSSPRSVSMSPPRTSPDSGRVSGDAAPISARSLMKARDITTAAISRGDSGRSNSFKSTDFSSSHGTGSFITNMLESDCRISNFESEGRGSMVETSSCGGRESFIIETDRTTSSSLYSNGSSRSNASSALSSSRAPTYLCDGRAPFDTLTVEPDTRSSRADSNSDATLQGKSSPMLVSNSGSHRTNQSQNSAGWGISSTSSDFQFVSPAGSHLTRQDSKSLNDCLLLVPSTDGRNPTIAALEVRGNDLSPEARLAKLHRALYPQNGPSRLDPNAILCRKSPALLRSALNTAETSKKAKVASSQTRSGFTRPFGFSASFSEAHSGSFSSPLSSVWSGRNLARSLSPRDAPRRSIKVPSPVFAPTRFEFSSTPTHSASLPTTMSNEQTHFAPRLNSTAPPRLRKPSYVVSQQQPNDSSKERSQSASVHASPLVRVKNTHHVEHRTVFQQSPSKQSNLEVKHHNASMRSNSSCSSRGSFSRPCPASIRSQRSQSTDTSDSDQKLQFGPSPRHVKQKSESPHLAVPTILKKVSRRYSNSFDSIDTLGRRAPVPSYRDSGIFDNLAVHHDSFFDLRCLGGEKNSMKIVAPEKASTESSSSKSTPAGRPHYVSRLQRLSCSPEKVLHFPSASSSASSASALHFGISDVKLRTKKPNIAGDNRRSWSHKRRSIVDRLTTGFVKLSRGRSETNLKVATDEFEFQQTQQHPFVNLNLNRRSFGMCSPILERRGESQVTTPHHPQPNLGPSRFFTEDVAKALKPLSSHNPASAKQPDALQLSKLRDSFAGRGRRRSLFAISTNLDGSSSPAMSNLQRKLSIDAQSIEQARSNIPILSKMQSDVSREDIAKSKRDSVFSTNLDFVGNTGEFGETTQKALSDERNKSKGWSIGRSISKIARRVRRTFSRDDVRMSGSPQQQPKNVISCDDRAQKTRSGIFIRHNDAGSSKFNAQFRYSTSVLQSDGTSAPPKVAKSITMDVISRTGIVSNIIEENDFEDSHDSDDEMLNRLSARKHEESCAPESSVHPRFQQHPPSVPILHQHARSPAAAAQQLPASGLPVPKLRTKKRTLPSFSKPRPSSMAGLTSAISTADFVASQHNIKSKRPQSGVYDDIDVFGERRQVSRSRRGKEHSGSPIVPIDVTLGEAKVVRKSFRESFRKLTSASGRFKFIGKRSANAPTSPSIDNSVATPASYSQVRLVSPLVVSVGGGASRGTTSIRHHSSFSSSGTSRSSQSHSSYTDMVPVTASAPAPVTSPHRPPLMGAGSQPCNCSVLSRTVVSPRPVCNKATCADDFYERKLEESLTESGVKPRSDSTRSDFSDALILDTTSSPIAATSVLAAQHVNSPPPSSQILSFPVTASISPPFLLRPTAQADEQVAMLPQRRSATPCADIVPIQAVSPVPVEYKAVSQPLKKPLTSAELQARILSSSSPPGAARTESHHPSATGDLSKEPQPQRRVAAGGVDQPIATQETTQRPSDMRTAIDYGKVISGAPRSRRNQHSALPAPSIQPNVSGFEHQQAAVAAALLRRHGALRESPNRMSGGSSGAQPLANKRGSGSYNQPPSNQGRVVNGIGARPNVLTRVGVEIATADGGIYTAVGDVSVKLRGQQLNGAGSSDNLAVKRRSCTVTHDHDTQPVSSEIARKREKLDIDEHDRGSFGMRYGRRSLERRWRASMPPQLVHGRETNNAARRKPRKQQKRNDMRGRDPAPKRNRSDPSLLDNVPSNDGSGSQSSASQASQVTIRSRPRD